MRTEQKTNVKNSIGRLVFVVLSLIIQVTWIVLLFVKFNKYSATISLCSSILAFFLVFRIYGKHANAAFKMPWIILILVFPVLGICLYVLFGQPLAVSHMRKKFEMINARLNQMLVQKERVMDAIEKQDLCLANQCRYIWNWAGYPLYDNTDVTFYKNASEGFEEQLKEMEKAEHFIFMEYHAIEEAVAFNRLKEVLKKKARQGVEVRLFYDDIGSIGFINLDFIKRMEKQGIKCRVFNPLVPVLNVFMNNRDHRKITVIDGKVGFTGGYNLADEYFNITHPYGYWKDTGIKLEGEAVRSLTVMFLEMWNAMVHTDKEYEKYLPEIPYRPREKGFVQPYADSPLDEEYVGENVYLNLVKGAQRYLYIATPYLIISDEMIRELSMAAKRGIDIRIVTPGIPDKKFIYKITRSYYAGLARAGVKIYEYTPGFIHEKQFLCDGEVAAVGTINLDYRSLYHHFENGTLIYGCKAVKEIEKDFEETFAVSTEVTEKYSKGRSAVLRIGQCVLRLISPLL